jgi:gas vesicle protein
MNNPAQPIERRAEALAELRTLHEEHAEQARIIEGQRKTIERLEDKVDLMQDSLTESRQNERVVTRKLIRLAAAMANMSTLAKVAEEIMHSVKEWHDETPEDGASEQKSAEDIVAQISHITADESGK